MNFTQFMNEQNDSKFVGKTDEEKKILLAEWLAAWKEFYVAASKLEKAWYKGFTDKYKFDIENNKRFDDEYESVFKSNFTGFMHDLSVVYRLASNVEVKDLV